MIQIKCVAESAPPRILPESPNDLLVKAHLDAN